MKIQLIQPPKSSNDNSRSGCYPPLGLLSIATHCHQKFPEAQIEVLDGEFLTLESILERLKPKSFVGVETKLHNYHNAIRIAKKAKQIGGTVILGGVFASKMASLIAKKQPTTIDYIIRGYGEERFVQILANQTGTINGMPIIYPYADPEFNSLLMPNRRFVQMRKYLARFKQSYPDWQATGTNIITIQGCKNCPRCLFCDRQSPKCYFRQPQKVWEEIQYLQLDYGVDYVVAFDDDILQDLNWLKQLVEAKPKGCRVRWHVFVSAAKINDQSVQLLKALGVVHVFIGVETADVELASTIGKADFNPTQCHQAITQLNRAGIAITPSFVFGLPGENESSLEKTLRLAQALKAETDYNEVNCSCLIPYPGSRAFARLARFEPELQDTDDLDASNLTRRWFERFCLVSYEMARNYSRQILALAPYRITLDRQN
ncbi:MAG: radical SAM protein [Candidatus Buchananbacteria bacterium]